MIGHFLERNMKKRFVVRQARVEDIKQIDSLQLLCYGPDFYEETQAFLNKITQPDNLCWVATEESGELLAYLMCVRATMQNFPCLNCLDYQQAEQTDTLYLHDMSIAPSARGMGIKYELLASVFQQAQALGLKQAMLVAVQGAKPIWEKQGFVVANAQELGLAHVLTSYGEEAVLMMKMLA